MPVAAAPAVRPAEASPGNADPARKKRRRRGGRGRTRREGADLAQTANGGESRVQPKAPNDAARERKPMRERPAREAAEPRAPIAAKPVVGDRGKPGLFQRIARFFSPR